MSELNEKAQAVLNDLLRSRMVKTRNTGKTVEMIQVGIILDSGLTRSEFNAMIEKITADNLFFISRKDKLLETREKQTAKISEYMLMDDVEKAGSFISDARNTIEVIDSQLKNIDDQIDCLDVHNLEWSMKRLEARQKASELSAKLKKEYAKLNALRSDLFDQLIKTQDYTPDECNDLTIPERF